VKNIIDIFSSVGDEEEKQEEQSVKRNARKIGC